MTSGLTFPPIGAKPFAQHAFATVMPSFMPSALKLEGNSVLPPLKNGLFLPHPGIHNVDLVSFH